MRTVPLVSILTLGLYHGLMSKAIHVDDNASTGGDGTSWGTAHKYLQDAFAGVKSGDEIWVAEGTYNPDQGADITTGDRTASFNLVDGVGMYGVLGIGFALAAFNPKDMLLAAAGGAEMTMGSS